MKRKLDNHWDVCHTWANRKQSDGYCGNMFFDDDTIYSYGRHFPIARWISDDIVLFTSRTYSRTTSGHISMVRSALAGHVERIYCQDVSRTCTTGHLTNLEIMYEELLPYPGKIKRSRQNKAWIAGEYNGKLSNFRAYVDIFRIKSKLPAMLKRVYNAEPETISAELEAIETKRIAKEKAKRFKQQAKIRKLYIAWQAGGTLPGYSYFDIVGGQLNKVLLRIHNERIETSKGANITIQQGRVLWPYIHKSFIGKCKINLPAVKVNGYAVNEIDRGNITIGCHKIEYPEMLGIAKQLKLVWETGHGTH